MRLFPLGLAVFSIFLPVSVLSKCVMYGFCHETSSVLKQQCLYNGPPKLLSNETGLKLLEEWCPQLFNEDGDSYVCCDTEQLLVIASQVQQMQTIFRRCPSCLQNILTVNCYSTCAPNMSDFIEIAEVSINEKTQENYVSAINTYFTSHFLDGAYKACSNVLLPSLGKLVTDATCGIYSSSQCNSDRWFEYFGSPSLNPSAPMKVNFIRKEKPFLSYNPLNVTVYKCNEAPKNSSAPCSCIDCEDSCPVAPDYPSQEFNFFILNLNGIIFVVICAYVVFLIAFLIMRWKLNSSHQKINMEPSTCNGNSFHRSEKQIHINFLSQFSDYVEQKLENVFYVSGKAVADHPAFVFAICSWFVAICIYGLQFLDITTDPVKIWASPTSRSRIEKDYFEERFEPFFRSQQIFFKALNLPNIMHNTSSGTIEFGPAFNKDFLLSVFELQQKIEAIPGLKDLCFAPLSDNGTKAETISQCTVESVFGYFSNDLKRFNETSTDTNNITINYLDHIYKCLKSSVSTECLAPYGGNVEPAIAVGGFLKYGDEAFTKADAIVVTYLFNNYLDIKSLDPAIEWEKKFIELVQDWIKNEKPDFMDVAFRAEASIELEIAKESISEIRTIVISYLCMFVYVSLALGSYKSWKTLFIDSKIVLGLEGIIVVLASVLSSVGIFGYVGTATTLLTMEVIPFLVLAVGVDNMFLIISTCSRVARVNKEPSLCVAETMSQIGPSLLLTTLSEAACFAIGAISDMPAVKTFALYAMVAIIINFFLQITAFVVFLTLDLKRTKARRFDIFCCFFGTESSDDNQHSWIETVISTYIVPVIFNQLIQAVLFICFITYFFFSISIIQYIEPGLEDRLSMPEDSYITKYFDVMDEVLSMGPNVYFVLKPGLNFTKEEDQNLVCGGLRCNVDSLSTQIHLASTQKKKTYLRTAASSWLDDYIDWSTVDGCCKVYRNGSFCPHSSTSEECIPCVIENDGNRPSVSSFKKYLPNFLRDNPDTACAKAGHAAYGQAVTYDVDLSGNTKVLDSYFMAYHTTLKTSKDYITALQKAREVSDSITTMLRERTKSEEIEVFPYSLFYVFYEQYLTIWITMITSLIYSFAAVFIVTFVFTNFDFLSSLIVLITVIMIVFDLAGLMYLWNINLNAITLVNLVVAVGISVEFCSHIVHSFGLSNKSNKQLRAQEALVKTGSSVFAGITLTKFIGILVLAFSKTQIFQVFYFRMYFGMIIFGAAHGLIFLPILLSYIGPSNKQRIYLRNKRTKDGISEYTEQTE